MRRRLAFALLCALAALGGACAERDAGRGPSSVPATPAAAALPTPTQTPAPSPTVPLDLTPTPRAPRASELPPTAAPIPSPTHTPAPTALPALASVPPFEFPAEGECVSTSDAPPEYLSRDDAARWEKFTTSLGQAAGRDRQSVQRRAYGYPRGLYVQCEQPWGDGGRQGATAFHRTGCGYLALQ